MKIAEINKFNVEEFIGKKLYTSYTGYAGQGDKDEFILGEVISEWDFARRDIMDFGEFKGKTRQEYWASFFTNEKVIYSQNKLLLITADGRNTCIYCNNLEDDYFCCSDDGRYVRFMIEDR